MAPVKACAKAGRNGAKGRGLAAAAEQRAGRGLATLGQLAEVVVAESGKLLGDIQKVDLSLWCEVIIDLSQVFDKETWIEVHYKRHDIDAQSVLGKLLSKALNQKVEGAIQSALSGMMGSLREALPDATHVLLQQIPAGMPFRGEVMQEIEARTRSEFWQVLFESHEALLVSSCFTLDTFIESLIRRVMARGQLDRDILDLAAQEGLFSGNIFDLLPDLRCQLLDQVEKQCPGFRRQIGITLDAFSGRDMWSACIPARDRISVTSRFTLEDFIQQACASFDKTARAKPVGSHDMLFHEQSSTGRWQGRKLRAAQVKAMLVSAVPSARLRRWAVATALRAKLPRALANQAAVGEITGTTDFAGQVGVVVHPPAEPEDVFRFDVRLEFQRPVRRVVLGLFPGLPTAFQRKEERVGDVHMSLMYPAAGVERFSARVQLNPPCVSQPTGRMGRPLGEEAVRDSLPQSLRCDDADACGLAGRQFQHCVEGAVQAKKKEVLAGIPVKASRLRVTTDEKHCEGPRWRCVTRITVSAHPASLR